VALGAAFGQAGTRELICNVHRTRYVMAMMHAALKIQGCGAPNESEDQ
jgi:hypothetical protein